MIPDRYGTVPPHVLSGRSGEVAADRVLHVQQFTPPVGPNTVAQPRLGRRPPPSTVLTSEHHTPPASTTWPSGRRFRIDPAMSNAWSRSWSNRPGRRQARRHGINSTRSGSSGPVAGSAPLTPWFLASSPVLRAGVRQHLLGQADIPVLAAAREGHHQATDFYRRQMVTSPRVIPPEYRPTPSSTR